MQAARGLEMDYDPEHFRERVGKLVKHKPVEKPERDLPGLFAFILIGCANPQAELEAEARQSLTSSFTETNTPTLVLRNVRRVGDAVCGEADFEYQGRRTGYRRFFYRPNREGAFETPVEAMYVPDGNLDFARAQTRDLITRSCSGQGL